MPTVPASAPSPAQQSGPPEGMLALAAGSMREAELKSRTPSLRERITGFISEKLGDDRDSYRRAQRITDALDLTPVGLATMAYDAGRMSDSPAGAAVGAGTLGLAIFAGPAARTANIRKLEQAVNMERAGDTVFDIWATTGWNRGADRMWKFEISDEASKLTALGADDVIGTSRLHRTLDHEGLYKAYPDMKGIKVQQRDLGEIWGQYHLDDDIIDLAVALPTKDKHSTALHEVQHAIQQRERFAMGGEGKPELKRWQTIAGRKWQELIYEGKLDEAKELARIIDGVRKNKTVERELYKHLAGEVEARNVQKRQLFPDWLRKASPPEMTEDLPRYKQISIGKR